MNARPSLIAAAFAAGALLIAPAARAQQPPPPAVAPADPLATAAALRAAGRNAEAALIYEQVLRSDPARAPECQRALAEIDQLVGHLTIRVDDPRARIYLDGRELPGFPSGATLRVDPGDHMVAAALGAAPPASGPIRVAARETRTVDLRVAVAPAPVAPPMPVMVAPQPQPLVVTPVVVDRPGPTVLNTGELVGTLLIVLGGITVAGGTASGIAALVMSHDAGDHCLKGGAACTQEGVDAQAKANAAATASTVMLCTGGTALIAGIIVDKIYACRATARACGPRIGLAAPRIEALPGSRPAALGLGVTW